jgi:hypothetical protein
MTDKNHDVLISPRGALGALRGLLKAGPATLDAAMPEAMPEGVDARGADAPDDEALRQQISSGLEEALSLFEAQVDRGSIMFAPDHGPASLFQSFLAETASGSFEDLRHGGKLDLLADGDYEAKFDEHDVVGWATSLVTWWRRLRKRPYAGPSETPDRIPAHARVAVLGDWGSGRYGAPISAATIEQARPAYDMVLHLGDVYYSGTTKEVQDRFLSVWPTIPGALSRALNSNHEMYSGGEGYFDRTLPAFHQPSSCFAVENDHFLLVGLDTGYRDNDLTPDQAPWLTRLVERAEARNQKVILFSHHQPYSAFEGRGDKIVEKLLPLLSSRRIFAWYWGHEHRAVVYDPHPQWGVRGRLVGHSGFPYFRDRVTDRPLVSSNPDGSQWRRIVRDGTPDAMVLDGTNPYVIGEESRFGPHGHVTLELDDARLIETFHAPDGLVLLSREVT